MISTMAAWQEPRDPNAGSPQPPDRYAVNLSLAFLEMVLQHAVAMLSKSGHLRYLPPGNNAERRHLEN